MARSITSFGIDTALAAFTARRRRGFMSTSGMPILAATVISFASLENIFERNLSCLPLRCWMFAHLEWPAMTLNSGIFDDGVLYTIAPPARNPGSSQTVAAALPRGCTRLSPASITTTAAQIQGLKRSSSSSIAQTTPEAVTI